MDERYDIIRMVRDSRFRYIRNYEPLKPYYQYMNTPEKGATMKEISATRKNRRLVRRGAAFFGGPQAGRGIVRPEKRPTRGEQPRSESRALRSFENNARGPLPLGS